jgi:uncharacterized protein YcnI
MKRTTRTSSTTRSLVVRAAAVAAATGTVLALAVAPAAAHVTVDPQEAEAGGYTVLNVRVPNERDNASTVRLELHLDLEHPLASVMPQPVPGWDVEVRTAELDEPVEVHGNQVTEVPSVIVWSGGEIAPGTFQQFPLSIGPLPEDADRLVFDAIQTYDNDEVVRWIEEPVEGEPEPEHPAAVLRLTAGDGGHGDTSDTAGDAAADDTAGDAANGDGEAAAESAGDAAQASGDDGGTDTTARVLGVAGLVAGAAGVAFGVLAGRRARPAGDAS